MPNDQDTNSNPVTTPVDPVVAIDQEPNTVPPTLTNEGLQPTKKSKKKWIIGGIISALVVILIGAGATAYFVYQSPEKVVTDGLVNILKKQPGTVNSTATFKNDDSTIKLVLDGKSDDKVALGKLSLDASIKNPELNIKTDVDFAATVDGDGYVKVSNVRQLLEKAFDAWVGVQAAAVSSSPYATTVPTPQEIAAQKQQLFAQLEPIITKVDNKWIKLPVNDEAETSKEQKCVADAFKKIQDNATTQNELAQAYKDNKFITIKENLGVKDGSYGYVLDFDKTKAKAFGDAVEKTSIAKEIENCSGDTASSDAPRSDDTSDVTSNPDDDPLKDVRVELWVSEWSHEITSFKISAKASDDVAGGGNFELDTKFDYKPVTGLSAPTDAVDFKTLEKEFESLGSSLIPQPAPLGSPAPVGTPTQRPVIYQQPAS